MERIDYPSFPGFESLYLEDSYVIKVETSSGIWLDVQAALLNDHPLFRVPATDEQYCYRSLRIVFPNVRSFSWVRQSMRPIIDPKLGADYGNIDFLFLEDGKYRVGGEWGELLIVSSEPQVVFVEEELRDETP